MHIDTRYVWIKERVHDEDLSIKKVPTAKNCADVERSQSLLQYYINIASLQDWYSTDQTPQQDEGDEPMMDLVTGLQARREHGNTSTETDSSQR